MSKNGGAEVLIDRMADMPCAQCGTRLDISALEPFSSVECPSCGNQDTVPARFGQFLLLNLINTGGMGGVYRARDESLGRLVAIKVMLQKLGENLEFVETFKREAQAAAKLNHPNVAQIYSYGQVQGQPFIVMELVSGHRFDRLIENSPGGLDPAMVLRIAIDIAEGLQAADEIGLVHGDIKPENILLDEKRKAKLVDFGIASFQDQAAAEGIWGTPYYIAPEKARGRKSDARADIYSLGATLFHALTGQPPFEGETPIDVVKARLTQDPPALEDLRSSLPKSLGETIKRMLQREPVQRHPTYASLLGDLRRCLQEVGASASPGARTVATGKRVVIKKRESIVMNRAGQSDKIPSPARGYIPRVEEQRAILRARQHKQTRIALGIVGSLVLIVAGSIWMMSRNAKKKEQAETAQRKFELTQAVQQATTLCAAIQVAATNTLKRLAEFDPVIATAQAVRERVTALTGGGAADTNAAAPMAGGAAAGSPAEQAQALVAKILDAAGGARTAAERVPEILVATEALRAGLTNATTKAEAAEQEPKLQEQKTQLDDVDRAITVKLGEARALAGRLDPLERDIKKLLALRHQEEERQRTEQERLDKIAAEKSLVADAASGCNPLLQRLAYKEAIKNVKAAGRTLKTDEGKGALAVWVDRYQRQSDLKDFLIEQFNKAPFTWGWAKSEDVLGADDRGVKLRGRQVAWASVSTAQFFTFVEHYVANPQVRRSVQGGHYLAAALYGVDHDNLDAAGKYRDKALEAAPALRGDVERLMPQE